MYLLINPSQKDIVTFVLFDGQDVFEETCEASNREMLQYIETSLSKHKLFASDVTGIAVVVGFGSFTSTRIAVTIANTWAMTRQIPVLGISLDASKDMDWLREKISQYPIGIYVNATYSAEPHIG